MKIKDKLNINNPYIVALVILLALAAWCGFLYLCYWVAKNVSYWLFYEDMVRETIREMVNTKALIL